MGFRKLNKVWNTLIGKGVLILALFMFLSTSIASTSLGGNEKGVAVKTDPIRSAEIAKAEEFFRFRRACTDLPTLTFNFFDTDDGVADGDQATLEAGDGVSVGTIYRYYDVTGDGTTDAEIEILNIKDARIINFDQSTSGTNQNFQPQIAPNIVGVEGYIDFEFKFFQTGSGILQNFIDFAASAVDVDGNNVNTREYIGFQNLESFTVEATNALTSGVRDIYFTFESTDETVVPGIDPSATTNVVYSTYESVSNFRIRGGILDAGGTTGAGQERLFSYNFDPCIINNFTNPNTTNVFDLEIKKTVDETNPNTEDTVSFNIKVENLDNNTNATGVFVTDILPGGLSYESHSLTQGSFNSVSGIWNLGLVPFGVADTLTLNAIVSTGTEGNTVKNNANISSFNGEDRNILNNSTSASLVVRTPVGPSCQDPPLFTFASIPTLEQGTALQTGAVYRFSSVATGVDALVTIEARSNATVGSINDSGSNQFQPSITTSGNPGFVNFSIKFVQSGTGFEITYNEIPVSGLDLDGNGAGSLRDFVGFANFQSFTIEQFGSEITQGTDGDYTTFTAINATNETGDIQVTTDNLAYIIYKTTSTVFLRAGTVGSGATREVYFDFTECIVDNFDSPDKTDVSTDLEIEKTVDDSNPTERDVIQFVLTLDNNGPLAATGVVVKDSLPDGLTLVNGIVSKGTFSPISGEWTVGTMLSSTQETLTLNYKVDPQGADITLTNYAFIKELNQNDVNSANDTSFVDIDVVTNPDADIEVLKSITNSTSSTIQFELKATNNGPVAATNVFVKDSLTTALTFVSVEAGGDGSFTSGTGVWDVGSIAFGDTSTIVLNYSTVSIVSGENYLFLQSLDQDDIDINNDTTSVPFTFNTFISGTVFEDITGDELTDGDNNFNDASGDQQALAGVEVHLYQDIGGAGLEASEDYLATTTTDANGNYLFEVPANDTYWIVVDSQTGEMTDGTTWPDQTYASAGALCSDGAGGTSAASATADPCYGGRNGAVSDDIPTTPVDGSINTAEHIIEVDISGNNSVSDIDFGFSFNVVTNIDDADEDGSSARWHQGSFRQFANNANQIDGDNEMRFVPAVAENSGTWWTITLNGTLMPDLIDGGTIFDGTAYNFQDPDQVRDTNTGTVGGDGGTITTVGTDGVAFSFFNRKELDINAGDDPIFLINSPEGNIDIRELGMFNSFGGFDEELIQMQNNPGGVVENNFIGPFADGTTPAGNNRANIGVFFNDSNNSFSVDILNNYIGFLRRTGIHSENEDIFITVRGNEIFENSLDADDDTDGISGTGNWTIEENLIRDVGTGTSSAFDGGSGIEIGRDGDTSPASGTVTNNTIQNNQSTGIAVIEDVNGLVISKNIITGNGVRFAASGDPKPGAGIKLINSDGERDITGVTISQNQISDNEGLGIDLVSGNATTVDGVSGNDGTIDTDFTASPNGLVDYPIITSVATNGSVVNITGFVGTDASRIAETFIIEVFKANNDGDNAGEIEDGDAQSVAHGEGEFYTGTTVTNLSGEFSSELIIPGGVTLASGDFITLTATDANGNTSEFSANYEVAELDIEIRKELLNNSPIPQDEEVTFYIIAENKGPTDATNVTVTDALTSQLTLDAGNTSATTGSYTGNTWTIGSMASGQIDTLTLVADPNTTGTGLSNTATLATVTEIDLNTANNSSAVSFDIATIIRGTVFEDITGDALTDGDSNFNDASGDQRALAGVEVHLYQDIGGVGLDATEDYIETVLTDANGVFSFAPPANDDYWVVVDSRSTGLSDGTTWAEQVYGPVGALCSDGAGGTATARTTTGVCYGGRRAETSDIISVSPVDADIANAEHIAEVTFSGTSITNIDFGFSYNVMTNTLDDADDDASATRWIQGSMRQFFLNANQISGANTMRFVPAVPDNDVNGNGWGILAITSAFPTLTDGNTTVDGTAYDFQDPDQVDDANSGSIGTGGTVGVDALSLPTFEDKELEINGADFTFITINSSSGNIIIKELAIINGSTTGAIVVSNNPDGSIEDNYIGIRNDGTVPANAERNEVGIFFDGVSTFTSDITRNYFGHQRNNGIESENENATINITENEIFRMGRAVNDADGISGVAEWFIEGNLIHRNGRAASDATEGGAGIEIGRDGELDEGTGTVINNTILDNYNVGINLYDYALNVTIEKNIITQNGEDGTAAGAGIKLINPDNERNIGGILITQNSFFDNEGLAIDIIPGLAQTTVDGVTPNDGVTSTDFSTNPNGAIDYPVIDSLTISAGELTIRGYVGIVGSPISDVFSIELYIANDDADNNGEIEDGDAESVAHGEGETYIATIFTASDGTFEETITIPGSITLAVGDFITTLAMDGENNTSEFSANYEVLNAGGIVSGFVFEDANYNGQKETEEIGITGVTIVLRNSTSGICKSISTDANGFYLFEGLDPDTYTIVESATETTPTPASCPATEEDPLGYVSTTENTINLTVGGGIIQNQNFGNFLGFRLDGTVFKDDSLTTGIANNGIQDGDELGLGQVTVSIMDNSDVLIQMTATDEEGNYSFWITEAEATNGSTLKIKQTNLTSYISTGGNAGTTSGSYDRATDVVTFTNTSGATYTGVDFGDVPQNRLLTDGSQFSQPGTSVFFSHQFDASTNGTVTFSLTNNATPANSNWPTLLYLDNNCNGEIDSGSDEIITDSILMDAGESICLIVRTSVPIGVSDGGENAIILQADFSFVNASPSLDQTYTRNDLVTVGDDVTAGLKITKEVSANQALPGAVLTYTITYINNGNDPITTLEVKDSTPAYTTFTSATFSTPLPNNLTGCTITAPTVGEAGGVVWVFTGALDPGQTGTVSYTVTIDD